MAERRTASSDTNTYTSDPNNGMTVGGSIPIPDLAPKITKHLLILLDKLLGDDPAFDAIKPIIPALVKLGVVEGIGVAEHILGGLSQEDSYPQWKKLIESATPEQRITLMEETRQAAIRDKLRQIQRNRERWDILRAVLSFAMSLLLAL